MHPLTETTLWGIRWLLIIVAVLTCVAWPIMSSTLCVILIKRVLRESWVVRAFSRRRRIACNLGMVFVMWMMAGFFAAFPLLDPYSKYRFEYAAYVAAVCTIATIVAYWPKKKCGGNPCAEI